MDRPAPSRAPSARSARPYAGDPLSTIPARWQSLPDRANCRLPARGIPSIRARARAPTPVAGLRAESYILGECLPRTAATVLRVAREYVDGVSGQRLSEREEFVEALSHDCRVVQVPLLASRRRTDLERLLSVFDQELRAPGEQHVLEVDEREIPQRYAPVLRRLEGAAASVEVADSMTLEDEVTETWGRMKSESAAKDAALAEKDVALVRERAEKDAALERQRAERAAAEERVAELERRLAQFDDDGD